MYSGYRWHLIRRAGVLGTGLLLLAAFTATAGDLTIGVSQTFKDLDPRRSDSVYDYYIINSVFDSLIFLHPDTLEPSPWVAASWEIVDTDRLRFHLHKGIRFHNGEELTADDVAFTLNWIADPENGSPNQTELIWMQESVVVDEFTVDVLTKPDYAPFAPGIASLRQPIVPKDTVTDEKTANFSLHPIGSGPYRFVEWRAGEYVHLERNDTYWLRSPNLDNVYYRTIQELSVMMFELESGGIDIADNMPASDVERFQEMPHVDVRQVGSLSYFHLYFNTQSPISQDIRFRKAVYLSMDWDEAVHSIFRGLTGFRAYGCIPPGMWASDREYLAEHVALQEDDDAAIKLFEELISDGVLSKDTLIRIHTPIDPRRRQLATIVATNLLENDVQAEVVPLEWGPLLDLGYRTDADPVGDFEMMILGWAGGADPYYFIYFLFHSDNAKVGSSSNMSWFRDPEVDRLIFEGSTTLDLGEREAKYVAAQRAIFANYVSIPGYHYIETRGVNVRVHGFRPSPVAEMWLCSPFHNVWVDE